MTDPDTGIAVLHTGDVRPDRAFLDRLERHPAVMPYLAKIMGMETVQRQQCDRIDKEPDALSGLFQARKLERVYLDTSAVYALTSGCCRRVADSTFLSSSSIGTCDMPSKVCSYKQDQVTRLSYV